MKKQLITIAAVMVTILALSVFSWAAETVHGYFVEFKNDTIYIRKKGGGTVSARISDKTYIRNVLHGETNLTLLPKNTKLYVVVENDVATNVTIEEVPK